MKIFRLLCVAVGLAGALQASVASAKEPETPVVVYVRTDLPVLTPPPAPTAEPDRIKVPNEIRPLTAPVVRLEPPPSSNVPSQTLLVLPPSIADEAPAADQPNASRVLRDIDFSADNNDHARYSLDDRAFTPSFNCDQPGNDCDAGTELFSVGDVTFGTRTNALGARSDGRQYIKGKHIANYLWGLTIDERDMLSLPAQIGFGTLLVLGIGGAAYDAYMNNEITAELEIIKSGPQPSYESRWHAFADGDAWRRCMYDGRRNNAKSGFCPALTY